jgi:sulfur carrier protein
MTVEVNGERVELADGAHVADAIARVGSVERSGRGIAVAVDGEVVPRDAWADTPLREGQKVEVVGAIQGG